MTYNAKDNCCFASGYALPPLLDAAAPIFRLFGQADALRSHVNHDPGTHNYELDNRQAFYRMLGDFFYGGNKEVHAREIPCQAEVKRRRNSTCPCPRRTRILIAWPCGSRKPAPRRRAAARPGRTENLAGPTPHPARQLLRAKDLQLKAAECGREEQGGLRHFLAIADRRRLTGGRRGVAAIAPGFRARRAAVAGETWDCPLAPGETALVVADGGRVAAAAAAERLLAEGYRVLALDPLAIGEASIAQIRANGCNW